MILLEKEPRAEGPTQRSSLPPGRPHPISPPAVVPGWLSSSSAGRPGGPPQSSAPVPFTCPKSPETAPTPVKNRPKWPKTDQKALEMRPQLLVFQR